MMNYRMKRILITPDNLSGAENLAPNSHPDPTSETPDPALAALSRLLADPGPTNSARPPAPQIFRTTEEYRQAQQGIDRAYFARIFADPPEPNLAEPPSSAQPNDSTEPSEQAPPWYHPVKPAQPQLNPAKPTQPHPVKPLDLPDLSSLESAYERIASLLTYNLARLPRPAYGTGLGAEPRVTGFMEYPNPDYPSIYQIDALEHEVQDFLKTGRYLVSDPGSPRDLLVQKVGALYAARIGIPVIWDGQNSIIIVRDVSQSALESRLIPLICNGRIDADGYIAYAQGEVINWDKAEVMQADFELTNLLSHRIMHDADIDEELMVKLRRLQRELELEQHKAWLRIRLERENASARPRKLYRAKRYVGGWSGGLDGVSAWSGRLDLGGLDGVQGDGRFDIGGRPHVGASTTSEPEVNWIYLDFSGEKH